MAIPKLLLPLLLLYSLHGSYAQTNITLGSTLTAGTNSSWLSPSEEFAFGFYRIPSGLFLLGIWFDKIPGRTLVWSANRDTPAPARSTVSLTIAGRLVLTTPNGTSYPISDIDKAHSASMQNNGNFVLRNSSSPVLWQSFEHPTDTILPGQTFVMGQSLYSNANGTVDFSIGRFKLEIQSFDGNTVMHAYKYAERAYWYTATLQPNVSLVFNQSTALMYLVNLNTTIYQMSTNLPEPIGDYYHRATIEDTGNFQQYVYPKANGNGWRSVWRAITEPCLVNGICGVYGFCTSPDNQTATCGCLPGYSLLDPNVPSKGCYPNASPQQCAKTTSNTEYTIQELDDTDLMNDVFADMEKLLGSDLESCKKAVLDDCFCMAATLQDTTCLKKRIPFVNARTSIPSTTGKRTLIKVPVTTNHPREGKSWYRDIMKVGLFTSIFLALIFGIIAFYYHPIAVRNGLRKPLLSANAIEINLRAFTFQELHDATNGFSNKLGRGGIGTVYSGALSFKDKKIEIAAKKLDEVMMEQGEKEFLTEVKVIGQTHHKNLVRLLGFCNEKNQRILVYELMKNGSLSEFLFREGEKPSWDCRANIGLEIAQGLLYLHEECENQIIHCDIKPQNVLLDKHYTAKISDFGLAKLLMKDQTRTSTNARGTLGYMAPEWLKAAPITAKVDVYSFGVMLLEIICCRKDMDLKRIEEESDCKELILTDWVISCARLGKLEMVAKYDPEVLSDFKRFERMAMVGLWCVHPEPILRPTMKKVTQMLEGTVEVGVPPLAYA